MNGKDVIVIGFMLIVVLIAIGLMIESAIHQILKTIKDKDNHDR